MSRAEPVRIIKPDGSSHTTSAREFKAKPGAWPAEEIDREAVAVSLEPPIVSEPITETLDAMIEAELKKQMRTRTVPRELDWTITTAIKFLAVRAKLPVAFGGELDEPIEREPAEPS